MRKCIWNAAGALIALAILPSAAKAQNVVVIEKTERLTIIELRNLATTVSYEKRLPLDHHDFVPVARQVRMSSNAVVLCRATTEKATQEAAIAFGKRLWLGYSPDESVTELIHLRKAIDCGYRDGMTLTSTEVAIRGDDADRRVLLTKWQASNGAQYMTALPCFGKSLGCEN